MKQNGKVLSSVALMMRDLSDHEPPTKEEAYALIRRAQAGDVEARNEMILRNMRFVVKFARRREGRGIDLEELIQVGVFGLCRAIDAFDCSRGYAFLTYAGRAIWQSIDRHVQQHSRTIRLPSCAWRPQASDRIKRYFQKVMDGIYELDSDEYHAPLRDSLVDPTASPEDAASDAQQYALLEKGIRRLPKREQTILWERAMGETMTAIGERLGISRERVRQLELAALEKLAWYCGTRPKASLSGRKM